MYRNYREDKQEKLKKLNKKVFDDEIVIVEVEIKQFSERDGKETTPFREDLPELEALEKELIRQEGFVEDLRELIADYRAILTENSPD